MRYPHKTLHSTILRLILPRFYPPATSKFEGCLLSFYLLLYYISPNFQAQILEMLILSHFRHLSIPLFFYTITGRQISFNYFLIKYSLVAIKNQMFYHLLAFLKILCLATFMGLFTKVIFFINILKNLTYNIKYVTILL